MPLTPTAVIGQALTTITSRYASRTVELIRNEERNYIYLSDADLRARATDYVAGAIKWSDAPKLGLLQRILSRLWPATQIEIRERIGIAIASAVFRRAPADIEAEDPQLRDNQLAAAAMIASGHHVQMDTGEGKTYALMAAAFAALGSGERVYVLTPNEVLAERDAKRTRPFWDWCGLTLGLCTEGYGTAEHTNPNWGAHVVYTTSSRLSFKYLNDVMSNQPPPCPVIRSAIMLDETDAILFDGQSDWNTVATSIATDPQSWKEAFRFAETLEPDDVVDRFLARAYVRLSSSGWQKITEYNVKEPGLSLWRFARMVEAAYAARHCTRVDIDYRIDGRTISAIDRRSGISTSAQPDWLIALSNLDNFSTIHSSEELYSISFLTLLRSFETVGGASGTASWVAIDLLLVLGLKGLPAAVEPQKPRARHEPLDYMYLTRPAAMNGAADDALSRSAKQPVLVGAQNARDALEFSKLLSDRMAEMESSPPVDLVLEDDWRVDSFDRAGEVGRITVTTYFAARGTDIRLTEEARARGLHLTLLGRSLEGRLDRQFLGRAGRQGDPWTGTFFSSLDMDLFQAFATGALERVMNRTLPEDEAIESRMVTNALARAQRNAMKQRQSIAASETMLSEGLADFHATYERILRAIQRFGWDDSEGHDVAHWLADNLVRHANTEADGPTVASFLDEALTDVPERNEVLAAVAPADEPHKVAVDQIADRIRRAVADRLRDIEEHRRYHRALSRFSEALGRARAITGAPSQPNRVLPTDADSMEKLDYQLGVQLFRADILAVAQRVAGTPSSRDSAAPPVDGSTETASTALDAPSMPAEVGLETYGWTISTPCLRPSGCARLTRSPADALDWEAHRIWRSVGRERDAAYLEVSIADASYGSKTRRRATVTEALTHQLERDLATQLVGVLLRLDQWESMNDTFYVRDHREQSHKQSIARRGEWDEPAIAPPKTEDRTSQVVRSFAHDMADGDSNSENVISAFLRGSPITSLQSGRACADAMTRFHEEDIARGVPFNQRRQNLALIFEFLRHAQAAQLIPEVPSRWDRVGSRTKRATLTLRYARHFDAVVALPALLLVVLVASFIDYDNPLDGDVTSVPLIVVWSGFTVSIYVVYNLVNSQRDRIPGEIVPVLTLVVFVVSLARGLLLDSGFTFGLVVSSAIAAVLSFWLWRFAAILQIRVGIDLYAGIGATVAIVAVVVPESDGPGWARVILVAAVVELVRTVFDRERIAVVGGAVTSLHAAVTPVDSTVTIRLGTAMTRYAGTLLAAILFWLLPGGSDASGDAVGVDVMVVVSGALVLLTVIEILRRLDASVVLGALATRRVTPKTDIGRFLTGARRRAVAREFLAISVTLVGAAVFAAASPTAPAIAGAMFVGVVVTTLARRFLESVYSSIAGFSPSVVVLDHLPEATPTEHDSWSSRLLASMRQKKRFPAIIVGAYVLIAQLLQFIDVVSSLRSAWDWGVGLLP